MLALWRSVCYAWIIWNKILRTFNELSVLWYSFVISILGTFPLKSSLVPLLKWKEYNKIKYIQQIEEHQRHSRPSLDSMAQMSLSCSGNISVSLVIPFEFNVQSVCLSFCLLPFFVHSFSAPFAANSAVSWVRPRPMWKFHVYNVLGVANSQQRTNKTETFMHFDGDLKQHITPNKALSVSVRRWKKPVCLAEGLWQAGAHLTYVPCPWGSSALPQPARRSSSSLWERLHLSFQPMAHLWQRNKEKTCQ